MKTTINYLDEVKEKCGLMLDHELAKYLGLTTTAIGYYRKRKSTMDDYTALKIAETLGIDPMEVIATANAERTKRPKVKTVWEKIAARATRSWSKPMPPIPDAVYISDNYPDLRLTVKNVTPIDDIFGHYMVTIGVEDDSGAEDIEMDQWEWTDIMTQLKFTRVFI